LKKTKPQEETHYDIIAMMPTLKDLGWI